MSSQDNNDNRPKRKEEEEDDDDDSSDEDYVPGNNAQVDNDDDEDDDDYKDDEETQKTVQEIKKAGYSKIESSEGGLIKTRNQRLQEQQQKQDNQHLALLNEPANPTSVDIDSIWDEMKSNTNASAIKPASVSDNTTTPIATTPSIEEEKIKITRTYEYAGETISEDKWVLKSSAEAKAYHNSLKIEASSITKDSTPESSSDTTPKPSASINNKPPPRKRRAKKSIVDNIIKSSKMAKISTLEKSRLDWANYVDSNKLNDELRKHNKDGYLSKQDFLSRVESNIDNKIKESKK
ncbi:Swc5 protein [Saccharomycopsis crataegensis]|uniref:SWR1-complex protein 5 n=1 Tax=Saccharomycopsis crataegensis TaxID=43959 RepID=A0AAV5QN79_9ASCO|nr:Swc5 protein [Saccharomycopsis crataegensis]